MSVLTNITSNNNQTYKLSSKTYDCTAAVLYHQYMAYTYSIVKLQALKAYTIYKKPLRKVEAYANASSPQKVTQSIRMALE
jgi:hypothetical protein